MIALLGRNNTEIDNQWLTSGVLCHTQLDQYICDMEGKKINTTVTKAKAGKAPGTDGFATWTFVLIRNILGSEFRIAYF